MPRIKIREGATPEELREALKWAVTALNGDQEAQRNRALAASRDCSALETDPDEEPTGGGGDD